MRRPHAWCLTFALGGALLGGAGQDAPPAARAARAGADTVVEFRLADQFGHVHDSGDDRGRPLYIVGAGRPGQASAVQWVTTLRALVALSPGPPSAATVVPVADLSKVPRLLRGFVRGRFSSNPQRAVLLDWDGAVARRLAFDPARCTVIAVGASGRPVLRTTTLATDTASIAAFERRADAAMRAETPPAP